MWDKVIAFIFGLLAQPLLKWIERFLYAPRLKLLFGSGEDFVSKNPLFDQQGKRHGEGYYVRVMVKNLRFRPAKGCRGFLAKIERYVGGQWQPAGYSDVISLDWSHGKIQAMDILYGINYPLDVVRTQSGSPAFFPCFNWQPFRYLDGFQEKTDYRLTVQVAAEEANPAEIALMVHWNGIWDDIQVQETSRPPGGWLGLVKLRAELMRQTRIVADAIQANTRSFLDERRRPSASRRGAKETDSNSGPVPDEVST